MALPDVHDLLDRVGSAQDYEAVSEAKRRHIAAGGDLVTVEEDGAVVAVGVAVEHTHRDGSTHWAVETAVDPGLAFPRFEGVVLDSTLAMVPNDTERSVWSSRRSLDEAALQRGLEPRRRLLFKAIQLPLANTGVSLDGIRAIRDEEIDRLIAINRLAFAEHREAAALDRTEFDALRTESWFDLGGIVVAVRHGAVVGFCWTKDLGNGDGEIYRIAVHPDEHGSGVGRALVVAGFRHLVDTAGATRGTLWVEESNAAAVGLYRSLGMETMRVNTEYA